MISREILSFPGAKWTRSLAMGLLQTLALCAEALLVCLALAALAIACGLPPDPLQDSSQDSSPDHSRLRLSS